MTDGVVPSYGPITFAVPGSFSFDAVYSGDTNNPGPVTSLCEPLTVANQITASLTDSLGIADTLTSSSPTLQDSIGVTDTLLPPSTPSTDGVSITDTLTSCVMVPGQPNCVFSSEVTLIDGSGFADQSSTTGMTVGITGSSGASALVSTEDLTTQPGGTSDPGLGQPKYHDAQVSGISDGQATVCITPADGANTMEYYANGQWNLASPITTPDGEVCGQVPVQYLTGTYIVVGESFLVTNELPGGALAFVLAGVAALVLVGALASRRKHTMDLETGRASSSWISLPRPWSAAY